MHQKGPAHRWIPVHKGSEVMFVAYCPLCKARSAVLNHDFWLLLPIIKHLWTFDFVSRGQRSGEARHMGVCVQCCIGLHSLKVPRLCGSWSYRLLYLCGILRNFTLDVAHRIPKKGPETPMTLLGFLGTDLTGNVKDSQH